MSEIPGILSSLPRGICHWHHCLTPLPPSIAVNVLVLPVQPVLQTCSTAFHWIFSMGWTHHSLLSKGAFIFIKVPKKTLGFTDPTSTVEILQRVYWEVRLDLWAISLATWATSPSEAPLFAVSAQIITSILRAKDACKESTTSIMAPGNGFALTEQTEKRRSILMTNGSTESVLLFQ